MNRTPEIDLAAIKPGSITAPAGHGKTEVIASTIAAHPDSRFLVLTHTNAGVAALRDRVNRYGGKKNAHIETIMSFTLRLVRAFPTGIGWEESASTVDYDAAKVGALTVLGRPTVLHAVASSYDHVIVDEYQDCTVSQHALVTKVASLAPTEILGDPLQAIFGFDRSDPLVPWDDVVADFPPRGELLTPHRWSRSNPALGTWLSRIRRPLLDGDFPIRIDPDIVTVKRLDREPSQGGLHSAFRNGESTVLLVGNSARTKSISQIARTHATRGVWEHEALQQAEVQQLCSSLVGTHNDIRRLLMTVRFLANAMTGVSKVSGYTSVLRNLETNVGTGRSNSPFATEARSFLADPVPASLCGVVQVLVSDPKCRVYRSEQVSILRRALLAAGNDWTELGIIARHLVDQGGHTRRARSSRIEAGSTLRVKGLEYDHVVLVNPHEISSREHLYVALSRAKTKITLAVSPGKGMGQFLTE